MLEFGFLAEAVPELAAGFLLNLVDALDSEKSSEALRDLAASKRAARVVLTKAMKPLVYHGLPSD